MPLRFRRSLRLARGVRLNIGTGGVSTSVGGRGGRITVGTGGARASVSAPGTGLSYSTTTGHRRGSASLTWWQWLICAAISAAICWWLGLL
jgi:hypothetical protein